MSLTIYGFAPSTFVQTVRLVAAEKAADYQMAPLEFLQPAHFALHPFGKMPVMDHNGLVLFEAAAIAVYLNGAFGGTALQPSSTVEQARMWQLISAALHYGYPTLVAHTLGDEGIAGSDPEAVSRFLEFANGFLGNGSKTDAPTLADFYLLPMLRHYVALAGTKAAFSDRQRLASWYETMMTRMSARLVFGD